MLYDINITMKNGNIRLYYDKCNVLLNGSEIEISYEGKVVACYLITQIEALSICTTMH